MIFLWCAGFLNAQENELTEFMGKEEKQIVFLEHPAQKFGFDDFYLKSWDEQPAVINGKNEFKYVVPVKSVSPVESDVVYAFLKGNFDSSKAITFTISGDTNQLPYNWLNDTLIELTVPSKNLNYEILAHFENQFFGKLKVVVYNEIKYDILLVPTFNFPVNIDTLSAEINALFKGANIKFKVTFAERYQTAAFNDSTVFDNPDSVNLREYTDQMFKLTHVYELQYNPKPNEYKIFIIPRFEDSLINGYMGLGNHVGFVTGSNEKNTAQFIAHQLGRGIGFIPAFKNQIPSPADSISHLKLSFWDWEQMRSGEAGHITWVESSKVKRMGAVVAYYFWEENPDGTIVEKSIHRPYKRNFIVSVLNQAQKPGLASEKVEFAVHNFMDDNSSSKTKTSFEIKNANHTTEKFQIPLKKEPTSDYGSVVFRKRNGVWISDRRKNVLYFNIYDDSIRRFSHANDSLVLSKYNIQLAANGHYIVKTYWKNNGKIAKQEVFAYNGENVTSFFMQPEKIIPKRILVFSNGYRGPNRDSDVSDNLVTSTDRYTYWMGIDKEFEKRMNPFETYYIDGSHGISTSGHKSMINFGLSIAVVKTFATKDYYEILNSKPNEAGFNERREKGKIAGKAFLTARCNSPACMETIDTVDIVCHSMGYAYALGFIDAIQGKVIFGKIYIIAAENACVGGTDWNMFEEVWQYGSNLDQPDPDPVWEQDGIAPQCQVKGLETVSALKGGRAFIPKTWPVKNFIDSHMLFNYFWMFECIKPGEPGYVKPMKQPGKPK